jgi:hypothetical protein
VEHVAVHGARSLLDQRLKLSQRMLVPTDSRTKEGDRRRLAQRKSRRNTLAKALILIMAAAIGVLLAVQL